MMRDAESTWALVVGIDEYASVKKLTGAARDAVDVVTWLRRLGVPDTNILLHAAPPEPTKAAVDGLGLEVRGCREPDLWESFRTLSKQQGSKLLVFLMGHGLFEPGGARVFLTQEADQEVLKNLGIDWYTAYLRGQAFTDQYVVMDGCLNLPYTKAERAKFRAGEQSGVELPPPRPDVRQVFCFSAQQEEKALEIDGHGLFTQTLLETLDPDHPDEGCLDIDDTSGVVRLDLARAVNDIVSPRVTAKAPRQHPGLQAMGAVRTSSVLPIVELVPERTARLRVTVDPTEAIEAVKRITLWSDSNDWRALQPRPPDTAVPTVFESVVPVGLEVVARLSVVQGGAWTQPEQQEFVAEADKDIVFTLAAQSPMPAAVDEVVLDVVSSDGEAAPATSTVAKAAITRALEEGDLSFAFDPAADTDLTVEMLPDGPMIRAKGGLAGGGLDAVRGITFDRVTTRVAKELDLALPARVSVRVRPTKPQAGRATPKRHKAEEATTLRFDLSHKDAVRLAGFLLDEPVVTVRHEPWSLETLARSSGLELDPGPATVRVELPWGAWSKRVRLAPGKTTTVALPERVGTPPLRVARLRRNIDVLEIDPARDGQAPRTVLTARSGTRPTLLSDEGSSVGELERGPADPVFTGVAWQLHRQAPAWRAVVEVTSAGTPLRTVLSEVGPLALDVGATPRAEPLSLVRSRQWDTLVASGRLEDVSLVESVALTFEKWDDPILGLAGAYGCLAHGEIEHLGRILENLEALQPEIPDLVFLRGALDRQQDEHRDDTKASLCVLERERAVPVLRWGVVFGQLAADHYGLPALAARLAALEEQLEPASTWTLWRVGTGES